MTAPSTVAVHGEFRLYETDNSVVLIPVVAGADSPSSAASLVFERSSPSVPTFVQSATAPPASKSRRASTVYGVIGLVELNPRDSRLIVITSRRLIGAAPHPLYRVTATSLVPLGPTNVAVSPQAREAVRLLKQFLDVPSLYFALDWDATLSCQRRSDVIASQQQKSSPPLPLWRRADPRFFWNSHLVRTIAEASELSASFVLPVFMGHAEVQTVKVGGSDSTSAKQVRLCVVSRRSRNRAGTRLFTRGIDALGGVANCVETEQVAVVGDRALSHVQVRGSIPVFWSQLPDVRYKPPPSLTAPREASASAARLHFSELAAAYGAPVRCISLVDQKGKELVLAREYAAVVEGLSDVRFTAFDFHKECKKGKTDRLLAMLDTLNDELSSQGYFDSAAGGEVVRRQHGIFRTNCVDNLDRSNVVQSVVARRVLEAQLRAVGAIGQGEGLDDHPQLMSAFKCEWVENGDAISVQYSGTGALKKDITKTGKRTIRGLADDGVNACVRYYKNNFSDGDLQDSYSVFLGHVSTTNVPATAHADAVTGLRAAVLAVALVLLVALFALVPGIVKRGDAITVVAVVLIYVAVSVSLAATVKTHGRKLVNNPRFAIPNQTVLPPPEKKSQ